MRLSLIAAVDRNYGIGYNGRLLARIADDMMFFREITRGSPVIMGRKTAESLNGPLEGRRNIVLSREDDYLLEGFEVAHTIAGALIGCAQAHEVFVIGGAELYGQTLKMASTVYLTHIDAEYDADAFFPGPLDAREWALSKVRVGNRQGGPDGPNEPAHTFKEYQRRFISK